MYYPPVRNTRERRKKQMTVYGNGILSINPDMAEIQVGAVTQHTELKEAQKENARIIQTIIQSLLELGISQEKIQTTDYNITPIYDYLNGVQQFKAYQVTQILSVAIEDISQTGNVIDTAVENGANRVFHIQFSVKNRGYYEDQALIAALNNAFHKARTIASSQKLQLDPIPVSIIELPSSTSIPIPYKAMSSSELVGGISTPIEPGQLTIEAKVEVKYSYE